jgi:hypothetical protein
LISGDGMTLTYVTGGLELDALFIDDEEGLPLRSTMLESF